MTLNELLSCASPKAIGYIKKVIKPSNENDYRKLKRLFDENFFVTNNFNDARIDIVAFDWQSSEYDRNWWWQLQALPFLNWFANSYELQTEEERARFFSLCLDAIQYWVSNAKNNQKSPLVWHDHAAAFRVRNLTNWLLFCHTVGLPISKEERAKSLANLIIEHLDWLQEDKHYSKCTNHGFDQSMIALTIGLMFNQNDFEVYRQKNRERLKSEVIFAFTDEGVHKENSPGYQKMMLARLKQLRPLALLGEQEICQIGERYIEKAEAFLRAITLPNGYLPMIGDTRGGDEGLPYEQTERVDILNYSASGYVIVRGADGVDKEFYILLKNSHESNYHRHDDDLMIYLFYDGKVVLGDGGLLNHNEKDARRIFLRSHLAHSVPYVGKKTIRNRDELIKKPVINLDSQGAVVMASHMFGEELKRRVEFNFKNALEISVKDSIANEVMKDINSNFIFGQCADVSASEFSVKAFFESFDCSISCATAENVRLFYGWIAEKQEGNAICSADYGVFKNAFRVVFGSKSNSEIKINFFSY